MPVIKSSAELRNSYSTISKECHEYNEPIFITVNGKGDLVVQSIESYEYTLGKLELYKKIAEGMEDIEKGETMTFSEAMRRLKADRKR